MKALTPFKQSFLGTLAAFLFIAGIFVAGVVFAQSGYDPNRDVNADGRIDTVDVQQVASSWNTTGSPRGVLTIFSSTTITNGAPVGARAGMHEICRREDPAAHFCNLQEIDAATQSTGVFFQAPFLESWVDHIRIVEHNVASQFGSVGAASGDSVWSGAYPIGDDAGFRSVANCSGWTTAVQQYNYGASITAGASTYHAVPCDQAQPLACCK